jgi:hypothetical protein
LHFRCGIERMLCLKDRGFPCLFRNHPEVSMNLQFSLPSRSRKRRTARALEGPVPARKLFGPPERGTGRGATYGLPRFKRLRSKHAFGTVTH